MRTNLVGIVLVACALACGGGGGGGDGGGPGGLTGPDAPFYAAYCKQYAACNADGVTEQQCLGYIPAHAPFTALVPDVSVATACLQSAPSCKTASACLPQDVGTDCRSPTELMLCHEGTCVMRDCTGMCEFLGHRGMGICALDGPSDAYCDCDSKAP